MRSISTRKYIIFANASIKCTVLSLMEMRYSIGNSDLGHIANEAFHDCRYQTVRNGRLRWQP